MLRYIIIVYLIFVLLNGLAVVSAYFEEGRYLVPTPKTIHEDSDMSMFGCIIAFLFYLIVNPILYIAIFIDWIFSYWRG